MHFGMKSTVFVRPNLKLILVAAVLIAVVQHLITNVHSQASPLRNMPVNAREISDEQLEELIKASGGDHSPELYVRISHLLEQKGDYRRALRYLRRADRAAQAGVSAE